MLRLPWRTILVLWSMMILVATLMPGSQLTRLPGQSSFLFADKLAHFVMFAGFGLIYTVTLFIGEKGAGLLYICRRVLIIGVLFGAVTEGLQAVLPIERSGSLADMAANTVGVTIGWVGGVVLLRGVALSASGSTFNDEQPKKNR